MTGASLKVDVEYRNFPPEGWDIFDMSHDTGYEDDVQPGYSRASLNLLDPWNWGASGLQTKAPKMVALVTITNMGASWTSAGHEVIQYTSESFKASPHGRVDSYDSHMTDRYRYGVKLILSTHGTLAVWDWKRILIALATGIVFAGKLKSAYWILLKVYAFVFPWSSVNILKNYQSKQMKPLRSHTRAAILNAFRSWSILELLDPNHTGRIQQERLFSMLQAVIGDRLDDIETAQLVHDLMASSDTDMDGFIAVDEFVTFMGEDEADIDMCIKYYKSRVNLHHKSEDERKADPRCKLLGEFSDHLNKHIHDGTGNKDSDADFQEKSEGLQEAFKKARGGQREHAKEATHSEKESKRLAEKLTEFDIPGSAWPLAEKLTEFGISWGSRAAGEETENVPANRDGPEPSVEA